MSVTGCSLRQGLFLAVLGIAACRLPSYDPVLEIAPPMPALGSMSALGRDVRRLELADLDLRSCAGTFGATNALAADFDGDGRSDSAVLLAFDISPEVVEWRGQTLRRATIAVVVVFGSAMTSRFEVIEQYDGFLPAGIVLDLVPPGRYELDGQRVTLDRPGLGVSHCEKSAAIYIWRSGKFDVIPVSD